MSWNDKQKWSPSRTGSRTRVTEDRHVAIVGGGLAGMAAAVVLAERGVRTTVLEAEEFLGGRAGAWTEEGPGGKPFEIERGFHAFFRQYYNLRNLLRRIDPELAMLVELDDYPVLHPDGTREAFAKVALDPPLNVLQILRDSPSVNWLDVVKLGYREGLEMLAYDPARTYRVYDGMTAKQYLDQLNLPPRARSMLFDLFAHSFFNPETELSAAEMLQYFHFYFVHNPEGLVFDMLDGPLSTRVWQPLRRYLEDRGGEVRLGSRVSGLRRTQDGPWRVSTGGDELAADAVVLALHVPGLQGLLKSAPDLGTEAWRRSIEDLSVTWPFAVLRLWLDGPVREDRAAFAAIADAEPLDAITIYEKVCDHAAEWAQRTGGSIVELHAYASRPEDDGPTVRRQLIEWMHRMYPETAERTILHERFELGRDAPAFLPSLAGKRPPTETPVPGLVLAGDLVDVPFPTALMERATSSGFLAANHLLADWDVQGEDLWSVPMRGMLRGALGSLPVRAADRVVRRLRRSR